MSETYKLAVRESLRESAFRRYERVIAAATKGSIAIDPRLLIPSMKPSSFKVGVREAIAGKVKFQYISNLIPPDYDLRKIVVRELEDGRIWLHNEYQDTMNKRKVEVREDDVAASLVVDANGNIAARNQKAEIEDKNIRRMEVLDRETLEQWCKEMIENTMIGKQVAWMVKASEPDELAFFKEMRIKHEGLGFEKLNFDWWRLDK